MTRDWSGPIRELSAREYDVARLLARGHPNKRIAHQLKLSVRTVEAHIDAIAASLPDPDDLPPRTLVMLWAAHQLWMEHLEEIHRPAA